MVARRTVSKRVIGQFVIGNRPPRESGAGHADQTLDERKLVPPEGLASASQGSAFRPSFRLLEGGMFPHARSSQLPSQFIQSPLVRPIFCSFGQTVTQRIAADVLPFLIIAFPASKLAVPKMSLP